MIKAFQDRLGFGAVMGVPATEGSRRSLGHNIVWTLFGNLGYALCQSGLLIVIAKLTSPETVGQYALALSITAPIMLLANMNLRAVQATDTKQDFAFSDYFALRTITTAGALVVIGVILLATNYSATTDLVIFFIGLAKAAESGSDTFYGVMQQHEKMDVIAQSMLLRGSVSLVVMGLALAVTGSIVIGSAALFATWLTVLILHDGRRSGRFLRTLGARIFYRHTHWSTITSLAWLSLPLGLVQLLISLNSNVPRYFIQHDWGEHELGIFAALFYLISGAATGVHAICNAVSPRLARLFQENDFDGFTQLITKLVVLFVAGGALAVLGARLFGSFVLGRLYTEEYAGAVDVLVLLTVGFVLGSVVSILGFGLTAARSFRSQVPLISAALGATTVGCALLIPRYGLMGAASAMLVSDVVWTVLISLALYRVVKRARAQFAEVQA